MTNEILKKEWKRFFDELSDESAHWQASIEMVTHKFGVQSLVDTSSLIGITVETDYKSQILIEITSSNPYNNHTYTIKNPLKVLYRQSEISPGRLVVIDDANGETTLINLHKQLQQKTSFGGCQSASLSYWENQEFL